MRKLTKDTQLCASIAERPGNFGTIFFNELFKELDLDFIYKAFRVEAKNLPAAIAGIKALGIRGVGVTMPHKLAVMKYLDVIDPTAREIGAVNTIVNNNGVLSGYNTDYYGVKKALEMIPDIAKKRVLLVGAGGIGRTFALVLRQLAVKEVFICNRDPAKARALAKEFKISYLPYMKRGHVEADVLINATSMGMSAGDDMVVPKKALPGFKAVIDVVVSPKKTLLIRAAEKLDLQTVPGLAITTQQALAQLKLYTGARPGVMVVEKAINAYFKS